MNWGALLNLLATGIWAFGGGLWLGKNDSGQALVSVLFAMLFGAICLFEAHEH